MAILQDFFTREEVAGELGISIRTLGDLMKSGQIKFIRPGRKKLIHRDEVERYLNLLRGIVPEEQTAP